MITALKKISIVFLVFIFLNTFFAILHTAPVYAAAATFSLSPASASKALNDTFSVDIIMDTGGDAVGGATAILTYDTTKLQAQGSSLTPGSVFGSSIAPFTNTIDATTGQIRYDSGTLGTPYTGRGTLATITFRTIAAGTAAVSFVFNPSATTGTSLIAAASGPTNLLTRADNGTYTIGGTGTSTYLPPTGALEDTLALLGGGMAFLGIGVFLARKAFIN